MGCPMRTRIFLIAITGFFWTTHYVFGMPPEWYNQVPSRSGRYLTFSCEGDGPASDLAIRLASRRCISMASDAVVGDFHVQNLSVETEKSAGFHEEVSVDRHVEGLSCDIQKQQTDEQNGSYHAWILCRFDTSKVRSAPGNKYEHEEQLVASQTTSLIVSTVPPCDSILIRGTQARVVQCDSNPLSLLVKPGDQELIFRSKGYVPKHIYPKDVSQGTLEVYLERE
jgi:hypothetical protein